MNTKDGIKTSKVVLIISICLLVFIVIFIKYISYNGTYAAQEVIKPEVKTKVKISSKEAVNLEEIIEKNQEKNMCREEIYTKQEELEYITKYRNNDELYVGVVQVSQEGKNGIQTITMKKTYDLNGNVISDEQVSCVVTKSSIDKMIDIGTKIYVEPEVKTTVGNLSFNMPLNKPSGFSLSDFEKILQDTKDVNKIFQNNAKYFYYIESEYNINGVFVAALGIHESGWGTSKIAKNKYNLFGYGAYDSNPYNGAYTFSNYSEAIDLIARVLVKYYLNPAGTTIYDGEKASGRYYNGNTLSDVNKKYASDKNWAKAIYSHMEYLYKKKN